MGLPQSREQVLNNNEKCIHEILRDVNNERFKNDDTIGGAEKLSDEHHMLIGSNILGPQPISAVLELEVRFGKNFLYGSGALIGLRYALTAARNVYNNSGWALSIRVAAAREEENRPLFAHSYACHVYKLEDCDLALLVLDDIIGSGIRCFKMNFIEKPDDLEKEEELYVTGYSKGEGYCKRITSNKGNLININKKELKLSYNIGTFQGNVGAPIWFRKNEDYWIIGIHVINNDEGKGISQGVILSKNRLLKISQLIESPTVDVKQAIQNLKEKWKELFEIKGEKVSLSIAKKDCQGHRIKDEILRELMFDIENQCALAKKTFWEALDLNFNWCREITDFGIKGLTNILQQNFPDILSLDLNFYGCYEITDRGFEQLFYQIAALKKLKHLSLIFDFCEKITDQSIIKFSSEIANNMVGIENMSLHFSYCEQITDRALNCISAEIIKKLQNLIYFDLNLCRCEKITDEGIINLSQQIGSSKKLSTLVLRFYGLGMIPEETKVSLEESLKVIKKIIIKW